MQKVKGTQVPPRPFLGQRRPTACPAPPHPRAHAHAHGYLTCGFHRVSWRDEPSLDRGVSGPCPCPQPPERVALLGPPSLPRVAPPSAATAASPHERQRRDDPRPTRPSRISRTLRESPCEAPRATQGARGQPWGQDSGPLATSVPSHGLCADAEVPPPRRSRPSSRSMSSRACRTSGAKYASSLVRPHPSLCPQP